MILERTVRTKMTKKMSARQSLAWVRGVFLEPRNEAVYFSFY